LTAPAAPSDLRPDRAVEIAVSLALAAGATGADAVAVESESSLSAVRLGEVEKVKLSRERRVGLRCIVGVRSAVASTADLTEEALRRFVADTVEMARVVAEDPWTALPDPNALARDWPDLQLADPGGLDLEPEERVDRARRCEAAALAVDPRLDNSEGADFSVSAGRVAYASSAGFAGAYDSTSYGLSVSPVARDGGAMQRDGWWDASRALGALASPEEIGRIAAERTLRRLGARPVPTQRVPVVFDPITAASLIGHLAGAVSGTALYRRSSFLLGRMGEAIASPELTVIDDARLVGAPGSRPFDGEGLPTRRSVIVENGVLRSWLLDTYAARRLGLESTASAGRGVGDFPAAGASNFFLSPGPHTPEEIIASVERGLYVTSLSGFGVNGVTGDYSRGAAGLWIERGVLTHPVEEVTIAGNLLDMLRDVEMIGDDLRLRTRIAAPTLKIREMAVAGT
jgi:PmbA protein